VKILVVEFSPSGGLYQFALQMADAYAAEGHEVEFLTGKAPELHPRHPGVRLLPLLPTWHPAAAHTEPVWVRKPRRALRAGQLLAAWLLVARQLRRSRPDVVQWAEWRFPLDGWFAARLARSRNASARRPVHIDVAHTPRPFAEQRTTGALYKESGALLRSLDRAYRAMDLVLVLGDSARQELLDTFPDVSQVQVIPHGDEGIFGGDEQPAPAGEQPQRVLFFGTLARYKGLDLLLDAFAVVREKLPEAELVIAGAVADIDIAALRERAERIGNVELHDGYVPVEAVAGLVGGARVVVVPYVIANQSGVVHLAQTFGRPVVATDVGDLSVAVQDGVTGLLTPPGDAMALADGLLRLLNEPDLASTYGAAGLERSRTSASWQTVAREVLPSFDKLLARAAANTEPS
jgi:glycosyltransferase involved in cell wall biosynthesis